MNNMGILVDIYLIIDGWLMISSGILLSNIGIMIIQERGIPNSSNQMSSGI